LWTNFGYYGAQGIPGPEALVYEINRIIHASGISSPVTTARGLAARLRYLDSPAGRAELARQGVTARRLREWAAGRARPSRASLAKIDAAYWTRRRENMIRSGSLKRLLDNNGRGRTVEIHPVDQSTVTPTRRRDLQQRTVQVRYVWSDLVDAYAAQDLAVIDEVWDDILADLDSDFTAYAYVSGVFIVV
jgi:hypothetical protein